MWRQRRRMWCETDAARKWSQLKSPKNHLVRAARNEKVLCTFVPTRNARITLNAIEMKRYILFHVRNLHINSLESVRAIVFFECEHIAQTCCFHHHHIVHCADLLCALPIQWTLNSVRTTHIRAQKRSANSVERAFDDNVLLATCIASMPRNKNQWKHLYFHFIKISNCSRWTRELTTWCNENGFHLMMIYQVFKIVLNWENWGTRNDKSVRMDLSWQRYELVNWANSRFGEKRTFIASGN